AFLAERLQVPVDGGQPDVLAPAPQLRVDLLGTAEARQALQCGRQGLRLPGSARPGPGPHGLLRLRHRHSRTVQPSPPLRPTRVTPKAFPRSTLPPRPALPPLHAPAPPPHPPSPCRPPPSAPRRVLPHDSHLRRVVPNHPVSPRSPQPSPPPPRRTV